MLCVSGINWDKNGDEKNINLIHRFVKKISDFLIWKEKKLSRRVWKFFKNSSAYPKSSFMFTCLPLTLNWAEKSIRDVCDSSWLTHEWKTHKNLATTTAENGKKKVFFCMTRAREWRRFWWWWNGSAQKCCDVYWNVKKSKEGEGWQLLGILHNFTECWKNC